MSAILKSLKIILLFVICPYYAGADNLPDLLRKYPGLRGAEKIETGLQVCDSLAEDPAELLRFALPLLNEAEKSVPGTLLFAKVSKQVSDGYFFLDSLRLSADYLFTSILTAEKAHPVDTLFLGSACNDIGLTLQDLGRRSESRTYLLRAIDLLKVAGDREALADALSNLGTLSYSEGKYEEAITLFGEAYKIDLETGNISRQSSSLNNLGRIYVDWGKYETGLDYYFQSSALLDTLADRRTMSVRYNNIGMVYQQMGKHLEAIRWIERAKAIDEEERMTLRLGTRYFNLANSHLALKNYQLAQSCFEKADSFYRNTDQLPALTKVQAGLGQLFSEMGDNERALSHFRQSLVFAEEGGSLSERSNSYKHLYEFYKRTGQPAEALRYFEKYSETRDSVFSLTVSKQVEELEMQYMTSQKEAEITRLESENEVRVNEASFRRKERNWAIAGLAFALAFMAGLYSLYLIVRRQKSVLAEQNQRLEKLTYTQNRLFGIISHDLRNAMAAYQSSARLISHYLSKGHPEKLLPLAPEISRQANVLSQMLENLLHWSLIQMKGIEPEKESVSLREETNKVITLLKEQAENKSVRFETDLQNEKVWCDRESLGLILRNLVNNALKFTSGGLITIRSFREDGHIALQVSDTGCGIRSELLKDLFTSGRMEVRMGTAGEKGTGLGLQLVAEHVEKNGGFIYADSRINEGTTITVRLPAEGIPEAGGSVQDLH